MFDLNEINFAFLLAIVTLVSVLAIVVGFTVRAQRVRIQGRKARERQQREAREEGDLWGQAETSSAFERS